MKKLIVLADLKRIRILELRTGGDTPLNRGHLAKHSELELELELEPLSRGAAVTDKSGRFSQGAGSGHDVGMSYGEDHNLDSELRRRAVERLTERIGELMAKAGHPPWILAAPKRILKGLLEGLPEACRATLTETVAADLTKELHSKLEERFV